MFFSAGWKPVGNKTSLHKVITEATGIQSQYLANVSQISQASIARKMSWASKRLTTRIKDPAYCLLGIFELNMALLYGEGQRSFIRLQEEILKQSDDQSIFCWVWDDAIVPDQWSSILAPCPAVFADSGAFKRLFAQDDSPVRQYNITNAGLSITLPLVQTPSPKVFYALLQVVIASDDGDPTLPYRASTTLEKRRVFHRCSIPAAPFLVDKAMEGLFENIYIQCKPTGSDDQSAKVAETLDHDIYDVGFMPTLGKCKPYDSLNAFSIESCYATSNAVYKNDKNLLLFSFSGVNASETFGAAIFKIKYYYKIASSDTITQETVALAVRPRPRAAGDDALAFSFHCAISRDSHERPANIIREIEKKNRLGKIMLDSLNSLIMAGKINYSDSSSDWKRKHENCLYVRHDEEKTRALGELTVARSPLPHLQA